jgi:hypothetical protein
VLHEDLNSTHELPRRGPPVHLCRAPGIPPSHESYRVPGCGRSPTGGGGGALQGFLEVPGWTFKLIPQSARVKSALRRVTTLVAPARFQGGSAPGQTSTGLYETSFFTVWDKRGRHPGVPQSGKSTPPGSLLDHLVGRRKSRGIVGVLYQYPHSSANR